MTRAPRSPVHYDLHQPVAQAHHGYRQGEQSNLGSPKLTMSHNVLTRFGAKDVKQMKMSVEGADVELTKVVLQWDNRRDDTLTDLGVLKAGGSTTPKDAPGRKGRLTAVTVQYKIVGAAPTAVLKIWGYD
jgi:hypothetical protein